ncbi:hypothetical protein [Anaerosporobacter sp.]|uniref:hypothetical protein n=1 Tax=Anaerosporobacter sp. TaxID=1872529 RepID=UPI00286FA7D2|nr:hypothetical protein [Anaerosporobacter sp.]
MKNNTGQLRDWAINKIKTEYPNDIAILIALEGHSVNGDGHGECFDYFVPATERGNELAQTFIIGDVGHDLYPRSWERTERTANLEDYATLCLGNAKVVYSRTKEDEEHFLSLQKKLFENLANPNFVYKKSLEQLNIAMDLYRTMMFEERLYKARMAAGIIHDYLSLAVYYLNGTYNKDWRNGPVEQLLKMKELPENFIEYYKAITRADSVNELRSLAYLTIKTARQFIATYKPVQEKTTANNDFSGLAEWYQELSLTWRRLYFYCDTKNIDAAFSDACNLQNELNIVGEEFGLKEMNLLEDFSPTNLEKFKETAHELENYIVLQIKEHGIILRKFDTLEEFLAQN